jgi:hypothetical protein
VRRRRATRISQLEIAVINRRTSPGLAAPVSESQRHQGGFSSLVLRIRGWSQPCGWTTSTIQGTPNLSVHMPNRSPHICFSNGMVTVPPSESLSQ